MGPMHCMLISKRGVGRLLDVRALRGEGVGMSSDHLLMVRRLKVQQDGGGTIEKSKMF